MNLHLKTVGWAGSSLALLCCLGFGPLIALLSAIGAGFLVTDTVLAPLLLVSLMTGGLGLYFAYRRHRSTGPLLVHILSAATVLVFIFVSFGGALVWLGVAGLVVASLWDFVLGKRHH
jgi:hypothetical protein